MIKVFAVMVAILVVELVAFWLFIQATGFEMPHDELGFALGAIMTGIAANIAFAIGVKRDW